MKKTFTILIAAIAAIMLITQPMKVVGQIRTDAYVLDFTTANSSHSGYSDTWTYNNATSGDAQNWSMSKGQNNNGQWEYVKFGGKGGSTASATTSITSYTQSTFAINSDVDLITVNIDGIDGNYTFTSMKLQVSSSSSFNGDLVDEITVNSISNSTVEFEPSEDDYWESGSYYKILITGTAKGKNNVGIKITTIVFQEYESGGSTPTAVAPELNPTGGVVKVGSTVTMSTTTTGGVIHYTTDGTAPTASSPTYSSAVTVNADMTIKAITVADGYNNSSVTTGTYKVVQHAGTAGDPYSVADAYIVIDNLTTASNVYVTGIVCTGGSSLSDGVMNYFISDDGATTDNFEIYQGKNFNNTSFSAVTDVCIGDVVLVKGSIKKYKNTYEFDSGSILQNLKLVAPTFYPVAGAVGSGTELTINNSHPNVSIYYTTDESTPASTSTAYNPSSKPTITSATTFKAIAIKDGCDDSDVATASYSILVPVATPEITLPEDEYTSVQSTTITCGTTGATIYYTTDESNPTTESSVYSGPISINEDMTIKAMATKEGMANSAVTAKTYLITLPVINAENVNLTCDATSASIAYTITNPVEGGVITSAAVSNDTPIGWLTVSGSNPYPNPIGLSCSANSTASNRTAKVTLTYTYDTDKTVTKEVTVTQAAYFPTPTSDDYVRISSLDQLVDGCIVIIAARHNSTATSYYAMKNTISSGKAAGVNFTSTTSKGNEILPASLLVVDEENVQANYYWVVNVVTENSETYYTFTNPGKHIIGHNSSTNFNMDGSKTKWTISKATSADSGPMVTDYSGFIINNSSSTDRDIAFNGSVFGPYSTTNLSNSGYNFYLDFFVQMPTSSKSITGVDNSGGGYYLIASPYTSPVTPTENNGFFANEYDLYRFNQSALGAEWENWKATTNDNHSDFKTLVSGKGYLYASSEDVTLYFTGHPYTGTGEVVLSYDEGNASAKCLGWNLIGNPYNSSATVSTSFYIMNDTRDELTASQTNTVGAMEGIFVKATGEDQSVTFTKGSKRSINSQIVLNVVGNNDNLIDRAIVRFDESGTLPKFMIDENNTKIYIPQNNKNFAVVNSKGKADMPVNFKAKEMGKYTISVNTEGIDMDYLHLIDRLTGEDVNLLLDNSYSFIASAQDVESRFILSFTAKGYNQDADEPFAFQNGSDIIVNGSGELQIFDLMGRMVSTQNVNGIETINVKSQGVYIFRLNEKTQKIVVR